MTFETFVLGTWEWFKRKMGDMVYFRKKKVLITQRPLSRNIWKQNLWLLNAQKLVKGVFNRFMQFNEYNIDSFCLTVIFCNIPRTGRTPKTPTKNPPRQGPVSSSVQTNHLDHNNISYMAVKYICLTIQLQSFKALV